MPSSPWRSVRRILAGFCWFWSAVCILLILVAVVMKVDPESGIHADLRDWRDVTKTAARNVCLTAFFVACALTLRVPGRGPPPKF